MIARGRLPLAGLLLAAAGCQPNPRNEIPAIAEAALADVKRTAPGQPLCVHRTIAPWRAAGEAGRYDPPAPPGYADLYAGGTFHGGGGLKGDTAGGVPVGEGATCLDLRGPIVIGDRAMIEVHVADVGLNNWLRRTAGDWRVVMTTSSAYRR